ncbi:hypothetical protein GEMRC1_007391 [Eukaryota sp. GEM-RC1]
MSASAPPFLISHQHISLHVDVKGKQLTGSTTITAVPCSPDPDIYNDKPSLFLNAQQIEITQASINDIPCSFLQIQPRTLVEAADPQYDSYRDFNTLSKIISSAVYHDTVTPELVVYLPPPEQFSFRSLLKKNVFTLKLSKKKKSTNS